jgi:hypothetical protein
MPTSKGDQTTDNLVVMETIFLKLKFIDRDTDLVFSNDKQSVCQFVMEYCYLHTYISLPGWWKPDQHFVTQTINYICNDYNTTMRY